MRLHLDGGIDQLYLEHFGPQLQVRVQAEIRRRSGGVLPVGESLVVQTGDVRIPFLIVAPTMERPQAVPSEHAYRAMRAVLRAAAEHEEAGRDVYCPGLATGTGRVPPFEAAWQMALAYREWIGSA